MRMALCLAIAVFILVLAGPVQTATALTPSPVSTPTVAPTASPVPISIELDYLDYPRVDGSTSAHPLQVHLACRILDVPCGWQDSLPFDATRWYGPYLNLVESPLPGDRIGVIQHNGTHGSYVNLIEGTTDFILVARLPSEDEVQAAQDSGVAFEVEAVALDAFVVLVNAQNPVDDLALETIRDIYTGKITHWTERVPGAEQSGDAGQAIHTYQRNRNSGSQELMERLVMRGAPMMDSSDEMILETMMGPINAINEDPLGIGYSVYYYAVFMLPSEHVKLTGVDGVVPTSDNIADRSYPLTTEVYAVIRDDTPLDSTAVLLRDWLLTDEGQAVIAESGYVPLQ